MQVLQSIDFEKQNIDVLVVENDGYIGSRELRGYIMGNNYTYVARLCSGDDIFVRTKGKAYYNFMEQKIGGCTNKN
jgi:hypothetical protein